MKIYLVRHGESMGNVDKTYHGRLDFSLSEKGRAQAAKLKGTLQELRGDKPFERVFTSEKKRTIETAEIMLELGEFQRTGKLNERDFGIFEGLGYKDIIKRYPKEYELWDKTWMDYRPEDGESHRDMCTRVFSFMDSLKDMKEDEDILLVCHGGVIRAIYCYVMDKSIDLYWKFACDNCHLGIIRLEYGNFFIDTMRNL